ncbi:MAG TPA: hypothetical protein VF640_04305 [Acidimicrobiales bacterium]
MSVDTGGGDPDGGSHYPSISPNGRHVSFQSSASDLVPDDGNRSYDVFARDLVTGTTRRVSVDLAGGDADGPSVLSSMSWSGRYVAFESDASDLVAGDGNGLEDVFVRDLATGTTVRASVDAAGDDADGESEWPRLSADGRLVAFHSEAGDLVPGDDNDLLDVYVRDLVAGTTTRVSVDGTGGDPNGLSYQPSISADGRHVAFGSAATDLVAGGDDGLHEDVFVRDLVAGVTTRVSVDVAGGDPDQTSRNPSTSGDGRYVAFYSEASDLVAGDGNGVYDVFVRDVATGTTTRVSVDRFGGDPSGLSSRASISEDGRRVAFRSLAWDLVPGGPDHRSDVFVRILG